MKQLKSQFEYKELVQLAKVACSSWRALAGKLMASPVSGEVTWFYVLKEKDVKYFTASNGETEQRPEGECETKNGSQWLVLTLWDNGWSKDTQLHPLVQSRFGHVAELAKQVPGVTAATIHCLGKGVDITTHTDGTDDRCYTSLVTIHSPEEDITLFVDGKPYVPNKVDVFSFNSFLPHSVKNTTQDDWVYLVLRINKDQYVDN